MLRHPSVRCTPIKYTNAVRHHTIGMRVFFLLPKIVCRSELETPRQKTAALGQTGKFVRAAAKTIRQPMKLALMYVQAYINIRTVFK